MATKKTHTTTRALRAAKLAASNHNSESFVAPGGISLRARSTCR